MTTFISTPIRPPGGRSSAPHFAISASTMQAMSLASGTELGRYTILALLSSGGMGDVYRARDGALDREVAIKVFRPRSLDDPDALRRFRHEGKALAALSHANILDIHDFETHENCAYAVTELLQGKTLRS